MSNSPQKLELSWIGKSERPRLEPRILIEDTDLSHVAATRSADDIFENMLIKGDNLLSLKSILGNFEGEVKCIYIDPPYNTGSAFEHYEDGLEHSIWLTMMRDRLELLQRLLSDDGVIFVHIDDHEHAYLKVLMDGVFGRSNFCGQIVWEKKKKPSFLNANIASVTEFILAYAKDRKRSPPFVGGKTTAGKKYPINNAGNPKSILTFPPHSVRFGEKTASYLPQDMSAGNIVTVLLDAIDISDHTNLMSFRLEGEWRYSQKRLDEIVAAGEKITISKPPFRPNHIKVGGEDKKMKNLLTVASGMSTYEDATAEGEALFGNFAFDYPKPEALIATLIGAVTSEFDIVLDSFAGSGTTGAVAHKMGRRWIMVELGDHAVTHIVPRLNKVVDGTDLGGITAATNWDGGGGYRFYRLAPSLMEKDRFGQWVIAKDYDAGRLAQAVAKHMGFAYAPSEAHWWMHGSSSETDFIYVTTASLTADQLRLMSEEVGPDRTLLVACKAFHAKADGWPNLTIKRIPQMILDRCEWGRDDYSLKVASLPPAPEPEPPAPTPGDLFGSAK